ncbi:F-type H+-transporting ATPase subunit g [Dendrobium catenatum]|uniref:F-type H+-transporting ATPase subunit g n=1 Tax=Dendrobium catenatum TaxID=906689 RepID=A0A2I0VME8_9ASPA|nr:F-type H+-transporting ATPase subunit g [Dendrobium catenatum]
MASKLRQLQAKAVQASQFVAKHGNCYYKQLLQQNKQYVVEPRTVEKCQELSKQLFYTRIARWFSFFLRTIIICTTCHLFVYSSSSLSSSVS